MASENCAIAESQSSLRENATPRWHAVSAVGGALSAFLDNVTTVVLIAPITILISEVLGLSPAPFLIAEALLSNTGGVATLVGDPPNVLIGSAAGFSFNDFLIHSLPVVAVAWFAALLLVVVLQVPLVAVSAALLLACV